MGGPNVTTAVNLKIEITLSRLGATLVSCLVLFIATINKYGRTFESGKALSTDFRRFIIDKILEKGGDMPTQEIPCGYADIARQIQLRKYGNRFVTNTKRKDYRSLEVDI